MRTRYFLPGILVALLFILAVGCATVAQHDDGTASIQQMDSAKATAVKARFAQDKVLAGQAIKVKVINCECTLEGTVPNEDAKTTAEQLAVSTEGIVKVNNQLKVKEEKPESEK